MINSEKVSGNMELSTPNKQRTEHNIDHEVYLQYVYSLSL